MKRSQRLEPVVKVAENREQQAAKALGEAQAALQQAQQRLAELKTYREEYVQRFHSDGATGMSAVQMGDYRLFLSKLSRAIEQQAELVEQAAARLEQQRQQWFDQRGKVKMLGNVVSRFQADERRSVERREQREQDERSQGRPSATKHTS
ncbi:MAG TPA: flagellar export protein FliJ [Gammaproteobacteria bacterium]|nr:flagellar export protein FliJ [Gammaproteobacteria bacterium]